MAGRPLRRARIALNNSSTAVGARTQHALAEAREALEESTASLEDMRVPDGVMLSVEDAQRLLRLEKNILASIRAWEKFVYTRNP